MCCCAMSLLLFICHTNIVTVEFDKIAFSLFNLMIVYIIIITRYDGLECIISGELEVNLKTKYCGF